MDSHPKMSRQTIRNQMRRARRNLSAEERFLAAEQVTQCIRQSAIYQSAQHLALYLDFDGELPTQHLIKDAWAQNKRVYLPLLHPFHSGHLLFQEYTDDTPMQKNQFAIAEPALNCSKIYPVNQLDILLIPLVAFDGQGNRLGMGGGFYDRTLATLAPSIARAGMAYDWQYYPHLPIASWDQPLTHIFTPSVLWETPDKGYRMNTNDKEN